MQELVHAIEGLDLDILQHVVGKAILKHGLELIPTKPNKIQYHDQKEPEHNLSHFNQEGMLQASQVIVQQLVEKGKLKGSIPKLDNLMVILNQPKFLFMFGRSKLWLLREIIHLPL